MPKSRGRKNRKRPPGRVVKLTADEVETLKGQQEAFRAKFGRDPGPNDPVFFDPNKDEPTPADYEADILAVMNKVGVPPEFSYAYRKTGLLGLSEDKSRWPPEHIKEWDAAVDEYRAIEAASKQPDRPSKEEWSTAIPELLVSPFTRSGLAQVHECLRAIEPIEAQSMTLITRIELAAAFVASACSIGYKTGTEIGRSGDAPKLYALTEKLVLQRAREIYAQNEA